MRNQTTATKRPCKGSDSFQGSVHGKNQQIGDHSRVHPAIINELPLPSFQTGEVSARIEEIKKVWSQGAGNSLELARAVWAARKDLPYGQWSQLWNAGVLPFSKRKGEMLVVVGERLGWVDAQTFAHLPSGWSVLHQLAQLSRAAFEQMVRESIIHPKLTLREAKELLARFKGRRSPRHIQKAGIQYRLRQFRLYVRRTVRRWKPAECELAKRELTRLLKLIDGAAEAAFFKTPSRYQNFVRPQRLPLSHPKR